MTKPVKIVGQYFYSNQCKVFDATVLQAEQNTRFLMHYQQWLKVSVKLQIPIRNQIRFEARSPINQEIYCLD